METVHHDYAPKGVKFFYVYKALAHPEINGFVQPFTLKERLMHVQEAKRRLGSQFTWVCDTMSNEVKHALGDRPNSEFVFDSEGRVVRKRSWSNPQQLRNDLAELVGPVEHPTHVSDLDIKPPLIEQLAGADVVPRVQLPGRLIPLKIDPIVQDDGEPFYVKLRAEAEGELLNGGQGTLYLGFFLDPLYKMHWNNLADPLQFDLKTPQGITVKPATGRAPTVKPPEDRDPREFLVDVTGEIKSEPLELTVRYFACDDAGTFCIPVTQRYQVFLARDPDGGARRRPNGADQYLAGDFVEHMLKSDRNGDGRISREEAPERLQRIFGLMDANGDDLIEKGELQGRVREFRRWFGGPSRRPSRGNPGRQAAFFQALDADGDGRLSKAELDKAQESFDRLDRNGDGSLTPDELLRPGRQVQRSRTGVTGKP